MKVIVNFSNKDVKHGRDKIKAKSALIYDGKKQQYSRLVDRIRELLPAARVYVLSITPVDAASPVGAFMNPQIETFNAALQKMAIEKGVDYIDLAPIFRQHKIQYDEDGSHFTNAFYPILLG
ncbi:GDSL-type esterase/lipase family protein [Paenibacillus dendritiformis]|nr:GDSL-type esterase/lipase family protein [Paenibacillus dendritiformis]